MSSKALVLLSAGLDSSYNLFKAREVFEVKLALTFHYGQKAAGREIACASALARQAGVPHEVVELPWFNRFTTTALVGSGHLPAGDEVRIDDRARSVDTAKSVWVPNRNGILLNIAAGFAEGLGADVVIPGFNAEEAATFPDNTGDFLQALDESWSFSTASRVRTHCFSTELSKTQIVSSAIKLGLPFAKLWPCYRALETWCGECESCLRFKRALSANGLSFEKVRDESKIS